MILWKMLMYQNQYSKYLLVFNTIINDGYFIIHNLLIILPKSPRYNH